MALIATKGEIPKNAIVLDRLKAIEYQWDQISNWPNKLEMWPFKYGIIGLSALGAFSGFQINMRYRKKFKLRNHGYFATSVPLVVAPAMFASAFHVQMITNDLLLSETKCPLCLQYRAAIIQILTTILYPVVTCPILSTLFALRHATYRVPHWTDFKGTLKLWWKFTKPLGPSLLFLSCVQAVGATFLTYAEGEKLYEMQMILIKNQEALKVSKQNVKESPKTL